jgi:hypothetical protein
MSSHRAVARATSVALALLICAAIAAPAGARRAPREPQWEQHASMRHARTEAAYALAGKNVWVIGGCAATANGLIACLGGEMTGAVFDTAEVYDVRRNRWAGMPSLPSGRTGFGSAVVGTRLYSFSGATDTGYLGTMESIDLRSYARR